jgi:hypothetical protein
MTPASSSEGSDSSSLEDLRSTTIAKCGLGLGSTSATADGVLTTWLASTLYTNCE